MTTMATDDAGDLDEVRSALERMALIRPGSAPAFERLTGGVSSDIWKVATPKGSFCVKRALPQLRVAQFWRAPVGRNAAEYDWMETAGRVVPDAVPRLLGHDPDAGLFAMAYLAPDDHPVWKRLLRDGIAEPSTARAVAERLVAIHAGTANDDDIAARFAHDDTFHAIRLEPYLEATARVHSDLAGPLHDLVQVTAATRHALIHGDVSPKNILIGPNGPVFLDAECACYGDPAFDLAFCLNHLLLKCLWTPAARPGFRACYAALAKTYLDGVTWEPAAEIEARTAHLLPGLLLARVDGKSPVEYLTDDADKDRVRRVARRLLLSPVRRLADIDAAWAAELET